MSKAWDKIMIVLLSIVAAFLVFVLVAYAASYRALVYSWLTQVFTVEMHIARGFWYTTQIGYPHLYFLRVAIGYGLALYGFWVLAVRYLPPMRAALAGWLRSCWQYIREAVVSGRDSGLALALQAGFSTMLALVCLEFLLRAIGFYTTYAESIGQGYISYFDQITLNRYNTYGGGDSMTLDHKDFKYLYHLNELGQREHPLTRFCDTAAFKVITLGDSYTEGVGTAYDSSWPRALLRYAGRDGSTFALYNGGQSGDDPFFEYMLYHERLKPCAPDLVIMAINTSDISDYFYRGGMERFHADGSVHFRHGSWMERLYASSRVFRFISIVVLRQRPQMFVSDDDYRQYEKAFTRDVRDILMRMRRSVQPGKLLVVLHPGPTDCAGADNEDIRHAHRVLMDVTQGLEQDSIYTIDLYESMSRSIHRDNVMQYTFVHDKHYNGKGYQLFAALLWREIERKYPDLLQSDK